VLESLADEQVDVELEKVDAKPPPKMAWVLIGIPTVKYGEISNVIEKLGRHKEVVMETTLADA
jgi:hypothetical protein